MSTCSRLQPSPSKERYVDAIKNSNQFWSKSGESESTVEFVFKHLFGRSVKNLVLIGLENKKLWPSFKKIFQSNSDRFRLESERNWQMLLINELKGGRRIVSCDDWWLPNSQYNITRFDGPRHKEIWAPNGLIHMHGSKKKSLYWESWVLIINISFDLSSCLTIRDYIHFFSSNFTIKSIYSPALNYTISFHVIFFYLIFFLSHSELSHVTWKLKKLSTTIVCLISTATSNPSFKQPVNEKSFSYNFSKI